MALHRFMRYLAIQRTTARQIKFAWTPSVAVEPTIGKLFLFAFTPKKWKYRSSAILLFSVGKRGVVLKTAATMTPSVKPRTRIVTVSRTNLQTLTSTVAVSVWMTTSKITGWAFAFQSVSTIWRECANRRPVVRIVSVMCTGATVRQTTDEIRLESVNHSPVRQIHSAGQRETSTGLVLMVGTPPITSLINSQVLTLIVCSRNVCLHLRVRPHNAAMFH